MLENIATATQMVKCETVNIGDSFIFSLVRPNEKQGVNNNESIFEHHSSSP